MYKIKNRIKFLVHLLYHFEEANAQFDISIFD